MRAWLVRLLGRRPANASADENASMGEKSAGRDERTSDVSMVRLLDWLLGGVALADEPWDWPEEEA